MVYIALLRGINVGGKNKIKMVELKMMFEGLGLSRVQTYIQSGNVLFESEEMEEVILRMKIEEGIEATFGFPVSVILRTSEEWRNIIDNNPFSEEEMLKAEARSDKECMYVAMLQDEPTQGGVERLAAYQNEHDRYCIEGKEVYQLFDQSIRDSKLASNLHRLGVPVTVRNWKTMNKLLSLAGAMGE